VGKTTLWEELKKKYPNINVEKVITTTTRQKRDYEVDGKDYYFVDIEKFRNLIKNKQLIEYAEVHNNFYGSTYDELERILAN
jgi:guanylate kinase